METRRSFMWTGIAATAAIAIGRVSSTLAASPRSEGPLSTGLARVNPEFREQLEALIKANALFSSLSTATLPKSREMMDGLGVPVLPNPAVTKRIVPGTGRRPDVAVYLTGLKANRSRPAVLHMHGGGYVGGSAASSRGEIQELAAAHDCVVLSVEYRLAPETPFPGPLEDNYAALRWLYQNAEQLGVDRTRIAIKGESAGGGHAAALAIAARDRGEIPICLQILVYPMLDDRTGSSMPVAPGIGEFVWTPASNRFGWSSLLGLPAGSSVVPPNSVPARVKNLAGLPPTWIGVGSIDLFASEDLAYGRRLVEAGVATEVLIVPGAYHGFDTIAAQAPLAVAFTQAWNAALTRAFSSPA